MRTRRPPAPVDRGKAPAQLSRGVRRFITWKQVLGAFLLLLLVPSGGFAVAQFTIDVPEANQQARAQSNVYLYSDDTHRREHRQHQLRDRGDRTGAQGGAAPFVAAENQSF
ncbi:hypothetical protein [Streptomyces sp. 11-1-2]|uniref:hypothetical protein n=1 Tax=unclassified Streptomyces TaxID=2593676 RepID=UPI0013C50F66|nr:hypothetical protein [Streptomyces sp. 11-1-2]